MPDVVESLQASQRCRLFGNEPASPSDLAWAMGCASSRAFRVPAITKEKRRDEGDSGVLDGRGGGSVGKEDKEGGVGGGEGLKRRRGEEGERVFLPVIDLANHDANPTAKISLLPDGTAELRALLPLPPRHAISIDYGRLSTDLFLLDYGFVPATNAHDTLPMAYGLPLIEAARAAAGLDGLEGRDGGEEQGGKGGGEAWETRTGTGEGKANAEKETGREERGEDTSGRRLEGPLDPDAGGGARARMEVISKLGLSGPNADRKMTLGGPGYIDPRLLAALRVLYAPALVDVRQLPLQELQGLDAVGRLGRECEQKTVRTLLGLCFIFLQSFSQVPPAEGSAAAAAAGKAAKDTAAATAGAGAGASKTPGSAAADSSAAAAVRLAAEAAGMESGAAERAIGGMTVQEARLVEAFRAEKRGLVLRVMSFLQGRLDV
ncbi:unnamed protein product [Closterium sp. NIES-54]